MKHDLGSAIYIILSIIFQAPIKQLIKLWTLNGFSSPLFQTKILHIPLKR